MGRNKGSKDLGKRKTRIGTPKNPLIIINGKKRFICKHHGLVSVKDTRIVVSPQGKEYGQCLICARICYKKRPNRYIKRDTLSEEEKIEVRKMDKIRSLKGNYLERQATRYMVDAGRLSNAYMKKLIRQRGILNKEITPELIDVCRVLVKIKRIKQDNVK